MSNSEKADFITLTERSEEKIKELAAFVVCGPADIGPVLEARELVVIYTKCTDCLKDICHRPPPHTPEKPPKICEPCGLLRIRGFQPEQANA